MSKLKAGDIVRILTKQTALDVVKNEVGVVKYVGPKDADGTRDIQVCFVDYDGYFQYPVSAVSSELEKVGTKIKWKKPLKIQLGDQLLLTSENGNGALGAVLGVVNEIVDDYNTDTTTFKGKGFEVVVTAEEVDKKVPVVV